MKNFTIRFLSKDNCVFYADNEKVELTYNYGKRKQRSEKWTTKEIERAEIQEDYLLFGKENSCYGAVRFKKENLHQVQRFVSIIENPEEPTMLINEKCIKKEILIYDSNLNQNIINKAIKESMIIDNKIILEVSLKKDDIGMSILINDEIAGKIYPKKIVLEDVVHSFLVFENVDGVESVNINSISIDVLKEQEINTKLLYFIIHNKDEISEDKAKLKQLKDEFRKLNERKLNRVLYQIPKIKKTNKNYIFAILLISMVISFIWFLNYIRQDVESGKITLEEFNRIQEGMSYEDVVTIIGSKGELTSNVDIDTSGLEMFGINQGDLKTELYIWQGYGADGANANIIFQGGKVMSKAQFGLK